MSSSLKSKTLSNISYSATGKVLSFAFQAVTNIILSRELVASDYGIVGFALILVNFLKGFGDLGINAAAIQRKDMDEIALGTAFTLRFVLGVLVYLIAFLVAGFAPVFFENPKIVIVIRLLALNIILYTFGFVPGVILSRGLNFKYIVISETILSIFSSVVAIILALSGFKFWSIVAANIVSNIAYVVAINIFMPKKILFNFDKIIAIEYLKYGSKIFLSGLLGFAVYNIDNFTIGAVSGDQDLGYYIIAFNWGSMVCLIMMGTVYNILFPTLSTIQNDAEKSAKAYVKVIEYVSLLSILFNIVLFFVCDDFLFYVLGKGTDKWIPSLIPLKILCLYGVVRSLLTAMATFYNAKGFSGVALKANFLIAALELLLVYPAVVYGSVETVAFVVLFSYAASSIIYLRGLGYLGLSLVSLWLPVKPAFISALITIPLCHLLLRQLPGSIVFLFIKAFIVTFIYIVTYSVLTRFKIARFFLGQFLLARDRVCCR